MLALRPTAKKLQAMRDTLASWPRPTASDVVAINTEVEKIGRQLAIDQRQQFSALRHKLLGECHQLADRLNGRQNRSVNPVIVLTDVAE